MVDALDTAEKYEATLGRAPRRNRAAQNFAS
jgi:hypothetical protein